MNIETATIFRTWVEIADALKNDADRGKFYHAICRYALYGELPDLPGILGTYFTLIRPTIDKSNRRKMAQQKGVQNRLQNDSQNNRQADLQNDLQNGAVRARKTGTGTKKRVADATPKETAVSFDGALPYSLNCPAFLAKWNEWLTYRKKSKRKPVTEIAAVKQLKLLAEYDVPTAMRMIDESIRNDWTGIFPPKATKAVTSAAGKDYNGI